MEDILKFLGVAENPVILIVSALAAASVAIAGFTDAIQKLWVILKLLPSKIPQNLNLGRRQFIFGSAAISVAAITGYFTLGYSKVRDYFSFVSSRSEDGYLVGNRKTGAIHHSKLCAWHLPDEANQVLDFKHLKAPYPHSYRAMNIYETMAKQHKAAQDFEKAAIYFKKAIEETPERVHLYDQLSRIYGKQKKYSDIRAMLENGLKKIDSEISRSQNKKQLMKVKADLNSRLERVLQKQMA